MRFRRPLYHLSFVIYHLAQRYHLAKRNRPVKIFYHFYTPKNTLTANFKEKSWRSRGEILKISPRNLRSNFAQSSNHWISTTYKTQAKTPDFVKYFYQIFPTLLSIPKQVGTRCIASANEDIRLIVRTGGRDTSRTYRRHKLRSAEFAIRQ